MESSSSYSQDLFNYDTKKSHRVERESRYGGGEYLSPQDPELLIASQGSGKRLSKIPRRNRALTSRPSFYRCVGMSTIGVICLIALVSIACLVLLIIHISD